MQIEFKVIPTVIQCNMTIKDYHGKILTCGENTICDEDLLCGQKREFSAKSIMCGDSLICGSKARLSENFMRAIDKLLSMEKE